MTGQLLHVAATCRACWRPWCRYTSRHPLPLEACPYCGAGDDQQTTKVGPA